MQCLSEVSGCFIAWSRLWGRVGTRVGGGSSSLYNVIGGQRVLDWDPLWGMSGNPVWFEFCLLPMQCLSEVSGCFIAWSRLWGRVGTRVGGGSYSLYNVIRGQIVLDWDPHWGLSGGSDWHTFQLHSLTQFVCRYLLFHSL